MHMVTKTHLKVLSLLGSWSGKLEPRTLRVLKSLLVGIQVVGTQTLNLRGVHTHPVRRAPTSLTIIYKIKISFI